MGARKVRIPFLRLWNPLVGRTQRLDLEVVPGVEDEAKADRRDGRPKLGGVAAGTSEDDLARLARWRWWKGKEGPKGGLSVWKLGGDGRAGMNPTLYSASR